MAQLSALAQLTLLFMLLYGSNAVNLDCGELSAADCKIQFETKFEKELKPIHFNLYKTVIRKNIDFLSAVMNELPKDDAHVAVHERMVKNLQEMLPKLNEDFESPEKYLQVLGMMGGNIEPNFRELTISEESAKLYSDAEKKSGLDEYMEFNDHGIQDTLTREASDLWGKLYADLRPVDHKTYPDYERFNERFQTFYDETKRHSRYFNFVLLMTDLNKFLNLPFFNGIYRGI